VKVVGVEDARAQLAELLQQAQAEPVVITKRGKPLVLVTGLEGQDLVQVIQQHAQPPAPAAKSRRQRA
jgi:prevent-host-death family protein